MLINCAVYKNGAKFADITTPQISDYLQQPDCFVWVALRDATPAELAEMQEEFGLHELAIEDARHGHQRPKIEEYGNTLFAVMQLVSMKGEAIEVGELDVFVGRNFVLSSRSHSEQEFRSVRARCEHQPDLLQQGSGFVLYALMDAVVDGYFPIIHSLEEELEAIEENIFGRGRARTNIEQLYQLKSRAMVVRHAVTPLMEAVAKLHGGRVPPVAAQSQDYFRDVHDHLARINATLDGLRDTIATAIQVSLSAVAIEQNEINKKLAAWAGIFAVITAFAGIWGMNFKSMPELEWRYGYPAALVVIVIASVFLYRRFKRAGWL